MSGQTIPNFSRYTITKKGVVMNVKTKKILKQQNTGGYFTLNLINDDNKRVSCRINRLVAITYKNNHKNHSDVNHKNAVKTDNDFDNLEWCSRRDNVLHAEKLGLRTIHKKSVVQMDLSGKDIACYESIAEASRKLGIDARYISRVCRKDLMKTHGFMWRYKDDDDWEMPVRRSCKAVEKRKLGKVVKTYKSMNDAIQDNNINSHDILRHAIENKTVLKGFTWRFVIHRPQLDPLYEETRTWRLIDGSDSIRISQDGRVYSDKYKRLKHLTKTKRGYLTVSIGKKKSSLVHRLVAKAYIPNPNDLPEVNHIKGKQKDDNRVENLEWSSHGNNVMHAHDTGLLNTRKPVIQYDLDGNELSRFKSITDAARDQKLVDSAIRKAIYNKGTSNGYIWRFESEPLEKDYIHPKSKDKKPVIQYDKEWNEINRFDSIASAQLSLGVKKSHIGTVCLGKRKEALGYYWKYDV